MRRKKGKVPPEFNKAEDEYSSKLKKFVVVVSGRLPYSELLQWATYMKSEDINLRTIGEQTLYSIWTDIFHDDRTPGIHMWDYIKRGVELYKNVELNAYDENLVDFINVCYDIEKFREQWKNTTQQDPPQPLFPLHSPQLLLSNNSSVHPQFSSQPSSSTSSIRPSRRVKPISLGKRIQDLTLPNTTLQANCPEQEMKFFEKIADNNMDNFCLNLWVKNVFSAVPKMQHYAHVYLILAWNEEYPTCIDHNGYIHLLNGMRLYAEKFPKPYNVKVKTLMKILRKLEKKKSGIFKNDSNE
ncbi:21643_t:CDS:2, partial [Cetraspora pellucida]